MASVFLLNITVDFKLAHSGLGIILLSNQKTQQPKSLNGSNIPKFTKHPKSNKMKALEEQAKEGKINENASVRDRQSAIINAPIKVVWELLTGVNQWPEWNQEIKSASCSKVEGGEEFEWTVKHTRLQSQFQVVEEPTLLTWVGKSKFIKTIFVWNLEASDEQTIVTVEESIEGFVIPIFNNHSKLHDILVVWLEALKLKAESQV